MKKILLPFYLLTTSVFAQPNNNLVAEFKQMVQKSGIAPLSENSFCYQGSEGVSGYQTDKLLRIASVSKLFTTYLASENLDLNKRFKTKFTISGDRLHISGGDDPFFEEEKLLLLMLHLNDLGYKSFKSVTFDSRFKFYDLALSAHANIGSAQTKLRLQAFFSKDSANLIRQKWSAVKKFAQEEGVDIGTNSPPSLYAQSVFLSENNPLQHLTPDIYVHKSRPLHEIIKAMNVMSKNFVSQNIYLLGTKVKGLENLLVENGLDKSSFKIYNGSGLPLKTSQGRIDNMATCRSVLKLLTLLKKSVKKHQLLLSDVLAVNGGKDLGSFRERFLDFPETHEAVISKTGTLMHASTLAGFLLMGEEVPFVILNQTTKVNQARKFQDTFVARMFDLTGAATPINYQKISIFPWHGGDFFEALE